MNVRVHRGGQDQAIGMMGGGTEALFLAGKPGAVEALRARRLLTAGFMTSSVGIGAMVATGAWSLASIRPGEGTLPAIPFNAFLGAVAVALSGIGMAEFGVGALMEAVEAHNQALLLTLGAEPLPQPHSVE